MSPPCCIVNKSEGLHFAAETVIAQTAFDAVQTLNFVDTVTRRHRFREEARSHKKHVLVTGQRQAT